MADVLHQGITCKTPGSESASKREFHSLLLQKTLALHGASEAQEQAKIDQQQLVVERDEAILAEMVGEADMEVHVETQQGFINAEKVKLSELKRARAEGQEQREIKKRKMEALLDRAQGEAAHQSG